MYNIIAMRYSWIKLYLRIFATKRSVESQFIHFFNIFMEEQMYSSQKHETHFNVYFKLTTINFFCCISAIDLYHTLNIQKNKDDSRKVMLPLVI